VFVGVFLLLLRYKMKIALLNLPFDNNYGGNLQRYALICVLQMMGHEVTHINLRVSYSLPFYVLLLRLLKRLIRVVLGQKVDFFYEKHMKEKQKKENIYADDFYNTFIPHTNVIYSKRDITKNIEWNLFDAVIVGSDQVWRYDMAEQTLGIKYFFLSFIKKNYKIKKIGYAISLGTYNKEDISKYKNLSYYYELFNAVSFREKNAFEYANQLGWSNPKPNVSLDPTLLLTKEEYIEKLSLKSNQETYVFCYILDESNEKKEMISKIKMETNNRFVKCTLNGINKMTIRGWVESIMNASMVVTDSYHGVVFSIIFERKVLFLGNQRRGNERLLSLFDLLHITLKGYEVIYNDTQEILKIMRNESLKIITNALYN